MTISAQISADVQFVYFRTWSSYSVPMRPQDQITYSGTEPLTAFYRAEYDNQKRLRRFTKYLKSAKVVNPLQPVRATGTDGEVVYFHALASLRREEDIVCGTQIPYSDTEGLLTYFRARMGRNEALTTLEHVTVEMVFDDRYSYWPNGQLKERAITNKEGVTRHSRYDDSGREI